jgi:hypothetical protein
MKYVVLTCCLLTAVSLAYSADNAPKTAKKPAAQAAEESGFSGKVAETMDAAGYTYVQVDTGKKKVWAASPRFAVKVGDTIAIGEPMPMRNYHSKTLNRDFDLVYFTGNVSVNGKQPGAAATVAATELPQGHPPIGGSAPAAASSELPQGHPPIGGGAPKAKIDFSGVKKADGGKTVEEIYTGKAALSGKEIKVRGKVVKYNAQIMGKNWLHIQDGTGAVGSNDLLVTSATDVKVGDTVLVTGKVATNKDFGANYKYAVMIDDAKVVAE